MLNLPNIKPFILAFLGFLLILQVFIVVSGAPRALAGEGDFPALYRAGQMVRMGERFQLYDAAEQERLDRKFFPNRTTKTNYFYHPPIELTILAPLALLPYDAAYFVWGGLGVVLLVGASVALKPQLAKFSAVTAVPPPILFLAFFPAALAISLGQDSILLLLVLAFAFRKYLEKRDIECGAILGLSLFKFQYVIPLLAILVLRKRFKLVAGFAATALISLAVSWAFVGTSGLVSYWHILFQLQPEMTWEMTNLRGVVETAGGTRLVTLAISACLFLWCALEHFRDNAFEFSAAIVCASLISYHMHGYDLTILLIPIAVVLDYSIAERNWLGIFLACLLFFTPFEIVLWRTRMVYLFALPPMALLFFLAFQNHSHSRGLAERT